MPTRLLTLCTYRSMVKTVGDFSDDHLLLLRPWTLRVLEYIVNSANDEEAGSAAGGWYGYENALCLYGGLLCTEFYTRGFTDDYMTKFSMISWQLKQEGSHYEGNPPWLEDTDILKSHRGYLAGRYPHYRKLYPGAPSNWPILFPLMDANKEDYLIYVAKEQKKLVRHLPRSVRNRIHNV